MIPLLLGAGALAILVITLGGFSRASIATLRQMGVWVAAIGAVLLVALLALTGKMGGAVTVALVLGPTIWAWASPSRPAAKRRATGPAPSLSTMTQAEAYAVLGLAPGASRAAIKAAHLRLMRGAHPDRGGSDWLAARINQARDILLG